MRRNPAGGRGPQSRGQIRRLRKQSWRTDEKAASGIVVTLLILLVAAGALSMFMAIYVPIWGKDTESSQMKNIQTQMLGLKQNIDLQILNQKSSTITTRITIGDDGGPLFHLTRTQGSLVFKPNAGLYIVTNTTDHNDSQGLGRGYLDYSSSNRYYVDQTYRYENGALLVIQEGSAVMKAAPHFNARRDIDGNFTASITIVSLTGSNGSRAGTGDVQVGSTLAVYDVNSYFEGDWALGRSVSFNLTTDYPAVWADFFNATLNAPDTGLVMGTDFKVSVWPGGVNATLVNLNRMDLGIAVVDMQMGM
jgi:hypothetical protein